MYDFERDGFSHFSNVCSSEDISRIERAIEGINPKAAGTRLSDLEDLSEMLFAGGQVGQVAAKLMNHQPRPVRAVFFDKSEANNWGLGWHQDRTIVVRHRIETDGFGPWTIKAGLQHVAPPMTILNGMVTLRVHLDAVPQDNAPLLVAKGSHRLGRIGECEIQAVVQSSTIVACLAERGDIWAYSTPILHASEPSRKAARRRVLQVDYASLDLPDELTWLGVT